MKISRHCLFRSRLGLTLLEISISIFLIGILMTGGYSLWHAQNLGLSAARENNIALWVLEGVKNRLLAEAIPFGSISERKIQDIIDEVKLPGGLKLTAEKIDEGEVTHAKLRLSLFIEESIPGERSRVISRTVELNE
ncbi:MAG: prepilin-type N-terminal cleavage/methylation domain-containing protein [Candidatus Riflebacteria bacterium]|nr:prepilin-type N-terminal cleavage/methylation domain-containing protein [Candidatus Riflebacteria bacterium]